ncbi:MAG TPA: type II toxin-antitoxin system Phd/YefM family antitoxin [Chromatiaceae bacterium]|jgi:hypothetical protein|nr:MAG: hypothetical protein N838_29900 [Thiohalocapsa sp. PB-PSB1]QQO55025.1 MAG: type II toxin-antitoxin system Phd/YefM family antitoxin [Thiohalocapsa sp. PB-PSB1]HBG94284.1 type II toxin-antitoxin system Phd/YefM family antitoxin [Chromatiaceae bacterium]
MVALWVGCRNVDDGREDQPGGLFLDRNLSALVDALAAQDEEIVIDRNGVAAAVLFSPDEFERWRGIFAMQLDAEGMREIEA